MLLPKDKERFIPNIINVITSSRYNLDERNTSPKSMTNKALSQKKKEKFIPSIIILIKEVNEIMMKELLVEN